MGSAGEGYRLTTLLDLRRGEEERCQGELADAIARVMDARKVAEAARSRRAEASRTADERAESGEASLGEIAADRRWLDRLVVELRSAEAALAATEARESKARAALAAAVRERQAIEKHQETWEAEQKKQRDRKEE